MRKKYQSQYRPEPYRKTERRDRVLAFIIKYKSENDGAGPSTREIMAACGISATSVVHYTIGRLVSGGKLYINANRHICVTGGQWQMMETKAVESELKPPSTMVIANAFEKHIEEKHNADFEVCSHPECERAYALEIGEPTK